MPNPSRKLFVEEPIRFCGGARVDYIIIWYLRVDYNDTRRPARYQIGAGTNVLQLNFGAHFFSSEKSFCENYLLFS